MKITTAKKEEAENPKQSRQKINIENEKNG